MSTMVVFGQWLPSQSNRTRRRIIPSFSVRVCVIALTGPTPTESVAEKFARLKYMRKSFDAVWSSGNDKIKERKLKKKKYEWKTKLEAVEQHQATHIGKKNNIERNGNWFFAYLMRCEWEGMQISSLTFTSNLSILLKVFFGVVDFIWFDLKSYQIIHGRSSKGEAYCARVGFCGNANTRRK